jgi:hypothetical protein
VGKHIKEHIDLVELLKALLLDSDKVYDKYHGPLQQYEQQEDLLKQFHDAWEEEQFEEAADFLVQFVECTGRELTDVERDKLREDIAEGTNMSDFGKPLATAFKEYTVFGSHPENHQSHDECSNHPIFHLYRLIEERTGIPQKDVDAYAKRLLSSYGIGPVTFNAGPDGKQRKPLPDLGPIADKLGEFDRSGKTGSLIAILLEQHPEALKRVVISPNPSESSKSDTGATVTENPLESAKGWVKRAYASYLLAKQNLPGNPTDRVIYEWLNENDPDWRTGDLTDYDLPNLQTWLRYVGEARKITGTQKNTPRHGRGGSGSVVNSSDI